MCCGRPCTHSTGGSAGEWLAIDARLELDATGSGFRLDPAGNAVGGIRTPQVDVPIAVLSGLGQDGESFCRLFGTTAPFDPPAQLQAAYPDRATFVERWHAATDAAVEAKVILPDTGAPEGCGRHVRDRRLVRDLVASP